MDVVCGDATAPDPNIMDPLSFSEAIDSRSMYYDVVKNEWSGVVFKYDDADISSSSGESSQFSWTMVRNVRNNMLTNSDTKINEDMPDAVKQPWLDYRKKLRDLPTDWSGIGTSTYLVAWPIAPDEKGGVFRP